MGESREFPAYRLDDSVVWGMTERILSSLLDHWRAVKLEDREA
jgi:hypothetical protein